MDARFLEVAQKGDGCGMFLRSKATDEGWGREDLDKDLEVRVRFGGEVVKRRKYIEWHTVNRATGYG